MQCAIGEGDGTSLIGQRSEGSRNGEPTDDPPISCGLLARMVLQRCHRSEPLLGSARPAVLHPGLVPPRCPLSDHRAHNFRPLRCSRLPRGGRRPQDRSATPLERSSAGPTSDTAPRKPADRRARPAAADLPNWRDGVRPALKRSTQPSSSTSRSAGHALRQVSSTRHSSAGSAIYRALISRFPISGPERSAASWTRSLRFHHCCFAGGLVSFVANRLALVVVPRSAGASSRAGRPAAISCSSASPPPGPIRRLEPGLGCSGWFAPGLGSRGERPPPPQASFQSCVFS